jgi:pimeloyl-ACP methyl ester carboxylesterase
MYCLTYSLEFPAVLLFWIGLALMCGVPLLVFGTLFFFHVRVVRQYVPHLVRIFQEKPLFIVPRGQPLDSVEGVRFQTEDGLNLTGCYLKAQRPRRGVILFGLEFGSNCWACRSYCEHLLAAGFDVFAFESRNQGSSDSRPGYDPLQWVTEYEVRDTEAALKYLKGRPDADPRGVGFFGISKGAGAGLIAAGRDPFVRCFVTDGLFATFTTLTPYMRQWFRIYNTYFPLEAIPDWYVDWIGRIGLGRIERERSCRFPYLEEALGQLGPRPLLMIHGAADTYIKPSMARALYDRVSGPRELWLVSEAKHNQALNVAGEEYRQRVLRFFERTLAEPAEEPFPVRQAECRPLALDVATSS